MFDLWIKYKPSVCSFGQSQRKVATDLLTKRHQHYSLLVFVVDVNFVHTEHETWKLQQIQETSSSKHRNSVLWGGRTPLSVWVAFTLLLIKPNEKQLLHLSDSVQRWRLTTQTSCWWRVFHFGCFFPVVVPLLPQNNFKLQCPTLGMTTHWFAVTGSCLLTYQRDNLLTCLSPSMFKVSQALTIFFVFAVCSCSCPHFCADEHSGYHQAVAVAEQCHYFLEETDAFFQQIINIMLSGCLS